MILMITPDRHCVIQVLGSLMKNPTLFNDTDKYLIEVNDFCVQLDKYVFSAIYNLYLNGADKIHAMDIENYLKTNPLAADLIEKENGRSFLQDCETYAEAGNFNYYYNKLKKLSFLRDIQKTGRKVDKIYCEDIMNDNYQKINDRFEKMTTQDILNTLRTEVAGFENKYVLNNVVEEGKPADSIRDRIIEWKMKPEVGCHLQGDIFNTIVRGGRKGKLYLRSASSGTGKALPNYTIVPTTEGTKTVGEVKVGDYLFDRHGKPTKVLAVYPQEEKKKICKVHFKSGRVAECCDEHLWSYYTGIKNNELKTSTTREIIDEIKAEGIRNNRRFRFRVPAMEPLALPEKDYLIPPYVMGMILSAGYLTYNEKNRSFLLTCDSEEALLKFSNLMFVSPKPFRGHKDCWVFEHLMRIKGHKNLWTKELLIRFPELIQCEDIDKVMPDEYLYGSIEQRTELLKGFMDGAGAVENASAKVSCFIESPQLKKSFVALCSSLGILTQFNIQRRQNGKMLYYVDLIMDNIKKIDLFSSPKKQQSLKNYIATHKEIQMGDRTIDPIVEIEETNEVTEMTCFYVDNEEHLFVAGEEYYCTHNTRTMVGDAAYIAYPMRYDRTMCKWVETGPCEKILYVMTEQEKEEIDSMILAYLTGYNEDVFTYATFDPEDPVIETAIELMEQYSDNFLYSKVADPCSSVIKNLFRRYNLQYGVENFFYDYIFSSPAMLEEYRDLKIREDRT